MGYCLKISQFHTKPGKLDCSVIPVADFTPIKKIIGYDIYKEFPTFDYTEMIIGEKGKNIDLTILSRLPKSEVLYLLGDFELNKINYDHIHYYKMLYPSVKIFDWKKYRHWYDRITNINNIINGD